MGRRNLTKISLVFLGFKSVMFSKQQPKYIGHGPAQAAKVRLEELKKSREQASASLVTPATKQTFQSPLPTLDQKGSVQSVSSTGPAAGSTEKKKTEKDCRISSEYVKCFLIPNVYIFTFRPRQPCRTGRHGCLPQELPADFWQDRQDIPDETFNFVGEEDQTPKQYQPVSYMYIYIYIYIQQCLPLAGRGRSSATNRSPREKGLVLTCHDLNPYQTSCKFQMWMEVKTDTERRR